MQPQPLFISATAPAESPRASAAAQVEWLNKRWAKASPQEILADAIKEIFKGRIAIVSSFGAEAAVLLHMVAEIDKATPVLFLETGKHFIETLTYRDILIGRFGFSDARSLEPDPADLAREDASGDLWSNNPDRCCHLRKVIPLDLALGEFDAWITGRKRYQTSQRSTLQPAELSDGKIKVNPLVNWTEAEVNAAFKTFKLPRHPLFDEGFASIGCAPCTRRILEGEDSRAGRWAGTEKTECGIHFGFTDGEGI